MKEKGGKRGQVTFEQYQKFWIEKPDYEKVSQVMSSLRSFDNPEDELHSALTELAPIDKYYLYLELHAEVRMSQANAEIALETASYCLPDQGGVPMGELQSQLHSVAMMNVVGFIKESGYWAELARTVVESDPNNIGIRWQLEKDR